MYISLIGAPCSGKGTHSSILQHEKHFRSIGAGDTLREYMKATNDLYIAELVNHGKIVPVEIIWKLMRNKIEYHIKHNQHRILLDGFPREQAQAEHLCEFLKKQSQPVYFIEFIVRDSMLLERMMNRYICDNCGFISSKSSDNCEVCKIGSMLKRPDDNVKIFQDRLRVYHNNLKLLKIYLAKDYKWIEIDAERTVEAIKTDIYHAIGI